MVFKTLFMSPIYKDFIQLTACHQTDRKYKVWAQPMRDDVTM